MLPRMVLAIILVALVGCGGNAGRGAVKGTVTVNGEPLKAGDIAFVGASAGGPSAGASIADGHYQIAADKGPVAGEYLVQIRAFRGTGKKTWDGMGEPTAAESQKKYVEQLEQYIPSRYNDATELTASFRSGKSNNVNFDLQSGGTKSAK